MGGAMSRNKGQRGEREVIQLLQPVVNEVYEAHGLEPPKLKRNTLQSDCGGSDVAGLPWLALEVKFHADIKLTQWWQQTIAQAEQGQEPVLFYRRNATRWMVKMYGMVGRPGCGQTVPVVIEAGAFLQWFRVRLNEELG